ncbi:hypothetical protein GW17_00058420 [Ensete ventricosum]|nr:hypothetical protein GW17_00058420 [Ensete ventricosum]
MIHASFPRAALACASSLPTCLAARRSPARRPRPRAILLPLEETERLPARGERSRRRLKFQAVPSSTGGTYRSVSLPLRGPPATGRYRKKSAIGGRLREKSTIGGRLKEIGDRRKREEEEEEKKRRRNRTSTVAALRSPAPSRRPRVARALSHPTLAGDFSPVRGDGTAPRTGRKIEATSPLF